MIYDKSELTIITGMLSLIKFDICASSPRLRNSDFDKMIFDRFFFIRTNQYWLKKQFPLALVEINSRF